MKITDKITTIVTHASCPDGKVSALILKGLYPDAEVKFIQYNTKEHIELKAVPGMIFCDFSPHRDRVKEFVDAGAYVLDHHKHAKDIVEAFGARGVFADETKEPGVSGAVLAYRIHTENKNIGGTLYEKSIYYLSTLAGIRDCWLKDHPLWKEACEQAAALHFYDEEYILENGFTQTNRELGKYLYAKTLKKAKDICDNKLIIKDRVGFMFGSETSDVADIALEVHDIDVLVGAFPIIEDGKAATVISMRSNGKVDVGAIAKNNGGGGHSKAAGFKIPDGNEFVECIIDMVSLHIRAVSAIYNLNNKQHLPPVPDGVISVGPNSERDEQDLASLMSELETLTNERSNDPIIILRINWLKEVIQNLIKQI